MDSRGSFDHCAIDRADGARPMRRARSGSETSVMWSWRLVFAASRITLSTAVSS